MGYREDIIIDKFSLDREWMNQPVLFMEWAEKSVEAQFERDKAKEKLDLVRAQIDNEIRVEIAQENKKMTEGAIQAEILQDERYQEANSIYLESVRTAKIMDVAREAFDHRKRALEKITDLWIQGYWADPKIRKEATDRVSSEAQASHRDVLNKNPRLRRRIEGSES